MDKPYFVHESAFVDGESPDNGFVDPRIGRGTRIWHGTHVMDGAQIGEACSIGQNVFVAATAVIGKGCRIQNNVSLYDGVVLEDFVFCGPSMTFTNLSYPVPRAAISRHSMYQGTLVRKGASIGAGAVIVCGHEIGPFSFIGAGAVTVTDVPAHAMMVGNPARRIGWICECGHRLIFKDGVAVCRATVEGGGECGLSFRENGPDSVERV